MRRLYIPRADIKDGVIDINGDEFHHLIRVIRVGEGEIVTGFDQNGNEYICRIREIKNRSATLQIDEIIKKDKGPKIDITLYQAVPKGDKMDYVIQKSVELGVSRICPVITKRVIADIDEKKAQKRLERWNRISKEASKQSQRAELVTVTDILDFKKAVDQAAGSTYCIFPYEKEESNRLQANDIIDRSSFSLFIGPEGGFDDDEVLYARQKGISTLTLGKRILRTETAPLAVLSILLYIKGEI